MESSLPMEVIKVRMTKGQYAWAYSHQTLAEFHAQIRTARNRLEGSTHGLHPLLRAPLLALADTAYWTLMFTAGLAVVAIFCVVLSVLALILLVPCTYVFISLIGYVPSDDKTRDDNLFGTSIALASIAVPSLLSTVSSLLCYKYPPLEDVDWRASFYDPLPLALQLVASYALLQLGLVSLVLLTFDFCVLMYWGGHGVTSSLTFCFRVIRQLPWYVLIVAAVPMTFLVINLVRKSKCLFEIPEDEQTEEFWFGSKENDETEALQHEGIIRTIPV